MGHPYFLSYVSIFILVSVFEDFIIANLINPRQKISKKVFTFQRIHVEINQRFIKPRYTQIRKNVLGCLRISIF